MPRDLKLTMLALAFGLTSATSFAQSPPKSDALSPAVQAALERSDLLQAIGGLRKDLSSAINELDSTLRLPTENCG